MERRTVLAAGLGLYANSVFPQARMSLPKIGLGTWQTFDVGNGNEERAPLRDVLRLLPEGSVLDCSPRYGRSETVAGDLVMQASLRGRLFMATKVWTSGRAEGIRQIETSFQRLRVEVMDLLQIHNLVDAGTHTKTLQELKSLGKV